jgi:hypothetical protein
MSEFPDDTFPSYLTPLVDTGALLKLSGRSVTNICYHSATCLGLF